MLKSSPEQKVFLAGQLPATAPEGVYKGTVKKLDTSWIGKEFFPEKSSGINNFRANTEIIKKYPFKTYTGPGALDHSKDVFIIDYDIPENPFWLRLLLDEIVETEPGKFVGKVHIRLLSDIIFTLGFFNLEK